MDDLSSLYGASSIRGIRAPFAGAIETSHVVITDTRIETVTILKPNPGNRREATEMRRCGGMNLASLREIRVVTDERRDSDEWDPGTVALSEFAGLPAIPAKRFFAVIVECLNSRGSVGFKRTIGVYERGGFTADSHRVGDSRLRVHSEETVRREAEALVRWIMGIYVEVYPERTLSTSTSSHSAS